MTATTTATKELDKLTTKKETTYADLQKIKRDRNGYAAETETMRADYGARATTYPEEHQGRGREQRTPKPGTDTEKMQQEIKRRMREPNPNLPAYEKALAAFHAADEAERTFRQREILHLIEGAEPSLEGLNEELSETWQKLHELTNRYLRNQDAIRNLIIDSPPLTGQHLAHDARAIEWHQLAAACAEETLTAPSVTELGIWQLDRSRELAELERAEKEAQNNE